MNIELLEEIGLTKSEIKVYQALLELGNSSIGPIVSKSKVASSKIYELLDKLIEKGLVTNYKEANTKYFKAVNPNRLMDYLQTKKEELGKKEEELKKLMPQLQQMFSEHLEETEVEVFKGYKGVRTAFQEMINTLSKGEEFLVIGGGDKPSTNNKTKIFFENIHRRRSEKGIIQRIIFSEARRKSLKEMSLFPHTKPRYLPYGTPTTINIYQNTTILLTMSPTPAAIRIKDKNITESYRIYFEKMWETAKE
ncbi:MAG: helix-turn-helix domain-containing protein [Nanoarchaeota archaeon]|nr:helix-turn-helix domain-containing protein [Nanoarchaeota archaeon]MBU1030313.1 helix-turn-helix domain-containing protein [Nanoarchaeota archaeon]MBU1849326.1 helix-turn-helix domain-containing protein [Nanoarchaeota archaeon]